MMEQTTVMILLLIFLAYLFDFTNGFHDAGNAIATIVATGVLTPRQAVCWAAFFNFIAFMFFNMMVAKTIGHGLVDPEILDDTLLFATLVGAIVWNLATWYFGLPSSSSHALVGALAGAALAKGGFAVLKYAGLLKVMFGIVLSPLFGLLASLLLTLLVYRLTSRMTSSRLKRYFGHLQLLSSAFLSLTHGGNDAQKTMGIIASILYAHGLITGAFYIPFWVIISCHAVISLGTLLGGWRIVHTMAYKITKLNRLRATCAETAAAAVIYAATDMGVPVSTTHTVTGAIAGVGLARAWHGTDWTVIKRIIWAWALTLPMTALIAAGIYGLLLMI